MAKAGHDLAEMFEQAAFLHQAGRLYRCVLNAKRNHVEARYQLVILWAALSLARTQ